MVTVSLPHDLGWPCPVLLLFQSIAGLPSREKRVREVRLGVYYTDFSLEDPVFPSCRDFPEALSHKPTVHCCPFPYSLRRPRASASA